MLIVSVEIRVRINDQPPIHALICDTSQRCAVITGTGDLINRGVAYTDFRARPRVRLFCYVFRMNERDCDCSQLATYTTRSNMAQHILEIVHFLNHRPLA